MPIVFFMVIIDLHLAIVWRIWELWSNWLMCILAPIRTWHGDMETSISLPLVFTLKWWRHWIFTPACPSSTLAVGLATSAPWLAWYWVCTGNVMDIYCIWVWLLCLDFSTCWTVYPLSMIWCQLVSHRDISCLLFYITKSDSSNILSLCLY